MTLDTGYIHLNSCQTIGFSIVYDHTQFLKNHIQTSASLIHTLFTLFKITEVVSSHLNSDHANKIEHELKQTNRSW